MPRKSKKSQRTSKKRRGRSKRAAAVAGKLPVFRLSAKGLPRRKGRGLVNDPLACFSEQTGASFG